MTYTQEQRKARKRMLQWTPLNRVRIELQGPVGHNSLYPLDETFMAELDAKVDNHEAGCYCDDCLDLRAMRGE